jgi:hypothetical protein
VRLLGNSSLVVDQLLQVRREEFDGIGVFWDVFRLAESGQAAEKNLTEIGEDGGATGGNAVLHKKDGNLTEKSVNAGGGMESREPAEEGRREILVCDLELESHVAAVTLLGGRLSQGLVVALPRLGQLFGRLGFRKSASRFAGSFERGGLAGVRYGVDRASVSSWLIHVVPRFWKDAQGRPSVEWKRVRKKLEVKEIGEELLLKVKS